MSPETTCKLMGFYMEVLTLRGPMSQICDVHVFHSSCRANMQKVFYPIADT